MTFKGQQAYNIINTIEPIYFVYEHNVYGYRDRYLEKPFSTTTTPWT